MNEDFMRIQQLATGGLCSLAALLLAGPAAAQGFEGVVTMQAGPNGATMVQTYKGTMVRTEVTGGAGRQGIMLMDNSSGKWTVLMPEQKMYMTMDMKAMDARMQHMPNTPRKPPKITDTGRSETIAGHSCRVYQATDEDNPSKQTEICAAKGMGYFLMGSRPRMEARGPWGRLSEVLENPEYARMFKDGFFPLRVSGIEGGKTTTEMLVTKIEPGSVDASAFQVPAGYTEMKMPGMGQRP
jgi:hypothetical protein